MNRHLALLSIIALVLAATSPTQAVIYGPTGDDGTFNAYQYVTNDRTWDAARVDAQNRSFLGVQGHLVTIKDAAENTFANNVGFNNERWIGLVDATAQSSTLDGFNPSSLGAFEGGSTAASPAAPAGQIPIAGQRGAGWRWLDGTPATFHNWSAGEPNNSGEEDAAHFTPAAGTWNDNRAGVTLGSTDSNRDAIVEYNTNVSLQNLRAFQVKLVKVQDVQTPGVTVANLAEAKQVIAGTRGPLEPSFNGGNPLTQAVSTINFSDNNTAQGFFLGDTNYPGFTGAQDNFVIRSTGSFVASTGGIYTFGVNSDDGFGLLIRDAGNAVVNFQDFSGQAGTGIVAGELQFAGGRGHSNDINANAVASYGRINLLAGQTYNFELINFEGGGGVAPVEAYWMLGTPTDYAVNAAGAALSFADGGGQYVLLGAAGDLNPTGQFNVTTHKLRNQINFPDVTTIVQADQVLNGTFTAPTAVGFPLTAHYSVINMNNSGSGNPTADVGAFTAANGNPDDPFFGIGGNSDDFVVQATGFIFIENPGNYTFGVRSDDGARLRIDINGDGQFTDADNVILLNTGVANFNYGNALLGGGWYPVELTYFERAGGADLEFFSAFNPGLLPIANGQNPLTGANNGLLFTLVGDTANGGLLVSAIVIPEPGTLGLLGLSALALLRRRRAA